jgi:nitroimidazol reductase NimA-like FMN-containing flavoprotein (pyridoxamine 5'-phosphate oxidase superfamily)
MHALPFSSSPIEASVSMLHDKEGDGNGGDGAGTDVSERVIDDRISGYLAEASIVRLATVTPAGRPHVAPYWFATDGNRIVISTLANQTVRNIRANPDVAILVDLGVDFGELRGALIRGRARLYEPDDELPQTVRRLVEEIDRIHASELEEDVFFRYQRWETRNRVAIEVTPSSATWFDLGRAEMGRTGRDAGRPLGPDAA